MTSDLNYDRFSCSGLFIVDVTQQFILLGETHEGFLSPQKGGVQPIVDESLFACACRETLEESGIQIDELQFAQNHRFIENAPSGRPNIMYWLAKLKMPKTKFVFDCKELKSVKWYHIETLIALQTPKLRPQRLAILDQMWSQYIQNQQTSWDEVDKLTMDQCKLTIKRPVNGIHRMSNVVRIHEASVDQVSCVETKNTDGGDQPSVPKNPNINESRFIVEVLRHRLDEIKHDASGFVSVVDLLAYVDRKRTHTKKGHKLKPLTLSIVQQIVEYEKLYSKQRLKMRVDEGQWMICANQGHSSGRTEYEKLLAPFPHLIHGTEKRFRESIEKQGLLRMGRTHIHAIACDPALLTTSKIISGFKKTSDLIVVIDMAASMQDGLDWFISENDVVLTVGPVAPKYLTFQDVVL